MVSTPLEELLLQYYNIDKTQIDKFSSTMNILDKLDSLGLKGDQFRNKMELTTILTKHGLPKRQKRVGGATVRGYEGIWYKDGIAVEVDI